MNPRFISVIARWWVVLTVVLALLPCVAVAEQASTLDVQLMKAAENGDFAQVINLLEQGADVNAKDYNFMTPLMHAAEKGHDDVVKLLLKKGAKLNATNLESRTGLTEAAVAGRVETVRLLIERKADVDRKDQHGWTALKWAAWMGRLEVAKVLLDNGADVNAKAVNGSTALREAVGRPEIVKLLLDKGANVNADKETLWRAVFGGDLETLQLLLDKGADANATRLGGRTLLMEAAASDHQIEPWYYSLGYVLLRITFMAPFGPVYRSGAKDPQIVKLLLQKGADVKAKDQDGWTALKRARKRGDRAIVELLKAHGAKE